MTQVYQFKFEFPVDPKCLPKDVRFPFVLQQKKKTRTNRKSYSYKGLKLMFPKQYFQNSSA